MSCGRPGGAVGEDAQPRLVFPFQVIDLDLQAGIDELGGKDFLAVLGMEAAGVVELHQGPSCHGDALRAATFQEEVVSEALIGGGEALQAVDEVEHAVAAGAVTEARVGEGGEVEARCGEDLGEILEFEKGMRAHDEPPAAAY